MADQRDYSSSWYARPPATGRPMHAPRHSAPDRIGAPERHTATDPWLRPPPVSRRPRTQRRLDASPWHWLLWLPIVVPLWPGLYNRVHPQFAGLPFYYWGQLAFALLAACTIAVVHVATKDR